jgi:predicted  nucleic acid-binding Zn-ribbon protein
MWNKVKWVGIGLVVGSLLYFNYQRDSQLKDMIQKLEVEVSHHRTDIIGLKGDIKAMGITITFYKNELNIANELFQKQLIKDMEHELGMMESKLKRLEEELTLIDEEYAMKDELLRGNIFNLIELSDTLKSTDKETLKGTRSLEEQFDQLRLEFDDLIQRLKNNKRTKDIFKDEA